MVTDLNIASYINRYLMLDTEINTALELGGGLGKFYGIQTQPESTTPYVRYTWRAAPDADMWWMERSEIAYGIYDNSVNKCQYIANLFKDRLRREDESAYEVNKVLRANNLNAFKIYSCEYLGGDNPEPTDEEGGAVALFSNFRITYSFREGTGLV